MQNLKIIFFFLFYILGISLCSQDIHFSQFWDPMSFQNPSNIGNFDGSLRISAIYRNQWNQYGAPLQTSFADATYKHTFKSEDHLSICVSGLQDKLDMLFFRQYRLSGTVAYNKFLSEKINIGAGVQFGTKLTSINYSRLTFDRQWDPSTGAFEPFNPSNETFNAENVYTPLLSAGVNANFLIKGTLNTFDIAISNINTPKDVYFQSNSTIPIKLSINAHSYIPLSDQFILMPKTSFLYSQKANAFFSGCLIKFKPNSINEFYSGFMLRWGVDRNSDAFTPTFGIKLNNLKIGAAVDITLSGLNQESQKGSFELSAVYIFKPAKSKLFSIDCMRL